jgi:FAD/FMN-containing dehydrogenase
MQTDDARNLLRRSLSQVLGEAVRFDAGHQAAYASDASNYRQVPIGVVVPRSIAQVVEAVKICRSFDVPILMRGAGTSQCGQGVNVAVVIDMSQHCNKILSLDSISKWAVVEPGLICSHLITQAEKFGLTFAPDPSTKTRCTIGGMIGNNACGPHSVMAGKTLENVEALEVLTYSGERFWVGETSEDEFSKIVNAGGRKAEIYVALKELSNRYANRIRERFPNIKRRVSGYNLDQLLPENKFNIARALVKVPVQSSCKRKSGLLQARHSE